MNETTSYIIAVPGLLLSAYLVIKGVWGFLLSIYVLLFYEFIDNPWNISTNPILAIVLIFAGLLLGFFVLSWLDNKLREIRKSEKT